MAKKWQHRGNKWQHFAVFSDSQVEFLNVRARWPGHSQTATRIDVDEVTFEECVSRLRRWPQANFLRPSIHNLAATARHRDRQSPAPSQRAHETCTSS